MSTLARLFILVLLAPAAADASDREDRLASGEIIVETQDVEGARLPRADAYAVIDAPVETVQRFLEDCRNYPGWVARVEEAELVKRDGDDFYCRIKINMPFPLPDLVATTRATHSTREGYFQRRWTLVEGDYERSDGAWILNRFKGQEGRTLVHYWLLSVPNLRMPDALVRYGQRTSLPDLINSVRKALAEIDVP